MTRTVIRGGALRASLVAAASLVLSMPASALAVGLPEVSTGKVLHARATSGLLTGTVNPEGSPTTYFFEYGRTAAYGSHTASGNAGSGTKAVKVGLSASPFAIGYHYRIVATNAGGTRLGKDRVYVTKAAKLEIELFKPAEPIPYGSKAVISGRLTGAGAANHAIALQASPWPYHEAFEQIGRSTVTSAKGSFSFAVGVLTLSTQFRVTTLDPLPRLSKVLTEPVAVRVTLKMRSSSRPGLVRLYGTVTPVEVGARVEIQVQKPARPGKSEKKEERAFKFITQSITISKRATKRFSRFSAIINLRRSGSYRAFVVTRSGELVAGGSRTIFLHAATGKHKKGR